MMKLIELFKIHKTVTNEEQARRASILKWDEINESLNRLGNWISTKCGFCALGEHNARARAQRCEYCPSDVKALCKTLDGKFVGIISEFRENIQDVLKFLREDFKVTDGSKEEKTDA